MSRKLPLSKKKCVSCEGGVPRLTGPAMRKLIRELGPWSITSDTKAIEHEWVMKDFRAAVDLINKVAKLAEKEDHHPDIHLTGYKNIRIRISTRAIDGLSENDFILASKIDKIPKKLKV